MIKRMFQAILLAIVILMSSLATPLKVMEVLGGNSCPTEEMEFVDHRLEVSEGENFDVPENLSFEGIDDLAENPYASTLLGKTCGIIECSIPFKDTIGTSIIRRDEGNSVELDASTGTFKLVIIEFEDKKWQFILCNGTENLNDYGKPTMPYKKLLIPLNGADVVNVEVEENCTKEFSEVDVLPGLKPLPLGSNYLNGLDVESYFEEYFNADPSIYQVDRPFPSDTVTYETVISGNDRILVLTVFPFKFYPTQSKIGVLDVHISIEFSEPSFGSMQFSSTLLQQEDPGYVIVTPSAFSSAVESLATWKEQLGFSVQITPLEYIYNSFPGRDNPEKLREFIKESYYTNGSEYYLLVGDCDVCPAREVWDPAWGPGLDNGTEPCDLYFECLDGDWDADGDSLFGEMNDNVDFFPEVKVGRLPVNTVQEAATVCKMIRKIEEDPGPGNWIKNVLLLAISAFTYGDCPAALEEEINQKFLAGSVLNVTQLYDVDGSLSTSAVVSAMNTGVGLVDFFDHGAYYTWVGALETNDVLNLQNGNKTFLAFAMACETAAFDYQQYTTISEAFFKNPNGGAIAYIGATRVAWAGYDCFDGLHHRFWRNFLSQATANMEARPKDAIQVALVEIASTYDMSGPSRETVYQAIYFGDPALNLYWKHNITTTTTPNLETNEAGTINGICQLLYSGIPISGQYKAVVKDPVGNLIAQQSGILGPQGNYTLGFSTGAIPGNYTVETSVADPFNYTHVSSFMVSSLDVSLELSSIPVYGTLLGVSGQVLDGGISVAGQANISIINNGVIVESKVVDVDDSGQYETQINITTFGRQELHVWASSLDDTKHGGASAAFKVKRGDILVLADDSGEMGPLYPGGWYDLNKGSSTSYYYFYAALEDEYNVSIYRIMYDRVPDLNLLQQYSAVVVTCGDHYGACLTSMYRNLTEVLTQYHNSGGDLLFEGGDLAFSLSSRGYATFMQSVLHASLISNRFNTGLYIDNSVPHPVTQGLPSLISLEGGLGSPSVDAVLPVNESEMVSGYVEYAGCSIIVFSGEAGLGHIVYFAFSIDGIADVNQRELLIRNSIGYIIFPTLTALLSDYALQANTTETILVRVNDASTGQLIENATVTLTGCGVSAQNTTNVLGECSIFIPPTSSGIISVTIQKAGYLDFSAQIVVYGMPKFMVKVTPERLKREMQTVDISVTDFYEGNPVTGVNVTLVGCGILETGYTSSTGQIQFVITPSYGNIQLTASKPGYEDYTTLLGVYIGAAVVDSYGTDCPEYSWWDDLNYLWENYGTTPIHVDITSLDKYGITYEDLVESGADVLIIPCAAATDREYTDSEISAIKKYTLEGHGLIATSGTLHYSVPNNNKLAPLFGMREDITYKTTFFSSLNILEPTHPLFVNIPSPYFVGSHATVCPPDYSWDAKDLTEGIYVALSNFKMHLSAIIVHNGVAFIGHWVGHESNNHDLQLMYNAITWSKYQLREHDLEVALEAPEYLEPNQTISINATVFNKGLNNETNVKLQLLINGFEVDSVTVSELFTNSSYTFSYVWTPMVEATYNVTVYAPPVAGEDFVINNIATKTVLVRVIVGNVVFEEAHLPAYTIGSNPAADVSGGYSEFAHYLTVHGYIVSTINPGTVIEPDVLAPVNVLVIVAPQYSYSTFEMDTIENWVKDGGKLLLISDWGYFGTQARTIAARFNINMRGDGISDSNENAGSTLWPYYDGANLLPNPITLGVARVEMYGGDGILSAPADEIPVIVTDSDFTAYWYGDGSPALGVSVMSAIDGGTAGLGRLIVITDSNIWDSVHDVDNDGDIEFFDSDNEVLALNSIKWLVTRYEHELTVFLEAPLFLELNDSSLLNATVRNSGLNNETDVELELLINENTVNSVTIGSLLVNSSHTLRYLWAPSVEGIHNITAYAVPVANENLTMNNVATRIVSVAYFKYVLFDQTHGADHISNYRVWVTNLTSRHHITDTHVSGPITSSVLANYDVFVIPQAHYFYTPDEVAAIKNFVAAGGGLLVIGDDYPRVYTELTIFAGISWTGGGVSGITTDITPHPVTQGITSVYLIAPEAKMTVSGLAQGIVKDSASGIMLAVSEQLGRVIGFADEGSLWNYGIVNEDNLPLANNVIDWLAIRYDHNLAVTLEAPSRLEPEDSTLLNATVYNVGLNVETNVKLQLLINGTVVDFAMISKLEVGLSRVLSHLWTPLIENKYNVTAYAVPVPSEDMITNNMRSAIVTVKILPYILVVADNDGGSYSRGTSLPEFESALKAANCDYLVWDESSMGRPSLDYLTKFNLVIWTCGDYWSGAVDPTDATTLEAYLAQGGNIILEGGNIGYDHRSDRFMMKVAHAVYRVDATGAPGLTITNPTHPVTRDLPTTITWETYPYCDDGVSPTNGGFKVIQYTGTILTAVTVFEGTSSGYVVYYSFQLYCLGQSIREKLVINSIERDIAIVDITASPNVVTAGEIVTIEVAVENQGTITETFDVAVYYDDTLIETSTIVNLGPHDNSILFFYWDTSGVLGIAYKIKAVASVVPHEIDVENNIFIDGTVTVYPPVDVYTQRGGRGEGAWSDAYAPQEEVIIFALMTYKGEPLENKPVAFEVQDPTGHVWLFRSNSTDANGIATVSFRIPTNPIFGTWNATAAGDMAGHTFNDTVFFKVGWIIEITQVKTVDNYGNPKTFFAKGEHIRFNVTVQNIAFTSKIAAITIVVYDECQVPIGQVTLQNWVIEPGRTEIVIIDLGIPKWAYVGVGTIYANAYTGMPQEGGIPYCPETLTTFLIKAS